jgi:hypothetical protein
VASLQPRTRRVPTREGWRQAGIDELPPIRLRAALYRLMTVAWPFVCFPAPSLARLVDLDEIDSRYLPDEGYVGAT